MGMLKRRLKEMEEGESVDATYNEGVDSAEFSDDSTTSEEEEYSGEARVQDLHTAGTKIKVMILSSRGVNARQRHLLDDLVSLMPHAKKESKFDTKRELFVLNELAEMNGCTHVMYFEAKKPQELFIWMSKSPSGPSVRFHVQNIHTLGELHLTGNCMKNARPILTFDPTLTASAHGQIMKELFTSVFGVPAKHRKTRPHFDRVMHFGWLDDHIWVRNYQIKETIEAEDSVDGLNLVEIGPRFVLHPVRILEGSFVGRTLWQNPNYVPIGVLRAALRAREASKYKERAKSQEASLNRKKGTRLPDDELDHVFD